MRAVKMRRGGQAEGRRQLTWMAEKQDEADSMLARQSPRGPGARQPTGPGMELVT